MKKVAIVAVLVYLGLSVGQWFPVVVRAFGVR